jgi:membrane protease YdiL (CAAX protease family)
MTALVAGPARWSTTDARRAGLLLAGLAAIVALRVVLPHGSAPVSAASGVIYGGLLAGLAVAGGLRVGRVGAGAVALGVAGGLVLVGFALVGRTGEVPGAVPGIAFGAWAAATVVVATGQELLLRGALFDAFGRLGGPVAAVAVTSVAFALIHVPFYGWGVVPLDLAVGIWLGGVRLAGGSVAAPVAAHIVADLATWWL